MSIDGFLYSKSTTKLSKIALLLPVQGNTRPSPIIRPSRLVSSQEKNTTPTQGTVRFRGIPNIEEPVNPSTKNLEEFLQHLTTNRHE